MKLDPEQKLENFNAATYLGTDDLLETLGVKLIAGRDFTPTEFVDWKELDAPDSKAKITAVIISKESAERLFPGQNALGKRLYIWGEKEDDAHRVVGIVDRLIRPNEAQGPADVGLSVILPVRLPYTMGGNYIMRVDPERRTEVLAAAVAALEKNSPNRIVLEKQHFSEIRAEYFRQDKAMAWLLVARVHRAARHHRAGHRRPGQLLGAAAPAPDRHPPRPGRHPPPDPALLPDRELPPGHAGNRPRHGHGVRHQPPA